VAALPLIPAALAAAAVMCAPVHAVDLPSPVRRVPVSPSAAVPVGVAVLEADPLAWLVTQGQDSVRLEAFPIGPTRTVDLNLARTDPLRDARVVVARMERDGTVSERPLEASAAQFWVGQVDGEPGSIAMLSRSPHFTYGYIEASFGTAIVSSGPVGSGLPIVAFTMQDLEPDAIRWAQHACELLEPPAGKADGVVMDGGIAGDDPCRQARIGVETDTELLARFGGNAWAARDYVATLFAAMNLIYVRDLSLHPNLAYLRLWEGDSDPWITTSSGNALGEFRDFWESNMQSVSRAMAHMLSGRGLGGGVAWLSSVCNSFSYAVSGNLGGYFPYPVTDNSGQNWDLMVVAHEMGHNLGAPHTHSENPVADGCGLDPRDCTVAEAGEATIMSYCHLCPGGIANMRMRFHEFSVESMSGHLGGISCNITGETEPPSAMADRWVVIPPVMMDLDVLANDLAFNCESVTIASLVNETGNATLTLVPGGGPEGRDIIRAEVDIAPGQQVRANYRLVDASGWWSPVTPITIDALRLRTPEDPVGDTAGVGAAYYALTNPSVLPDFSILIPYLSTSVPTINFPSTGGAFANSGRAENVGALYTAWLDVPEPGEWRLYTNSDDGSKLWVGDQLVVNNDGLHGMVEVGGTIALARGRHQVTVGFFERGGGAGLIVSWEGPGTAKEVVPGSRWTRGGAVNWADVNRDSTVNALDLAAVLAAWGSTGGGAADANRDGRVTGSDLAVVLAGWTG
jgi:hypothetical protein